MTDNPKTAAEAIHLRYVSDTKPGIQRRRAGKGFTYLDPYGQVIRDAAERARIEAIAIPPAWTEVWISPNPNGHILASGRDEKGRKQYRYHPEWNAMRNSHKFDRMKEFGECLPKIREVTEEHLRLRTLSREKVLALVVRLLEITLIRIGNREYAAQNEHYGLTTLLDDHVSVEGGKVQFEFVGKSGKEHTVDVQDKRLAKAIKACQDIPGYQLFQYYDADHVSHPVESADVNAYLQEITGEVFTAKDFRTWGGSVLMVEILAAMPPCEHKTACKKAVSQAMREVAKKLGNTTAVCRHYYVCPAVISLYTAGRLGSIIEQQPEPDSPYALSPYEAALLALLQTS